MRASNRRIIYYILLIIIIILYSINASTPQAATTQYTTLGFLPYWIADTGYTPPKNLYTNIAFFDAPVYPNGTINTTWINQYQNYINNLKKECHCHIWITFTMFNTTAEDELLANHILDFVDNAYNITMKYGFYGVIIDFEGINDTNTVNGENNTILVQDLITLLYNKGLHIGICIADYIDTVYRNPSLAGLIDYAYLMAYDYHWSGSNNTGPVSPFMSPGHSMEDSLMQLSLYYPMRKIILGLPLYGYDWPAENCTPGAKTLGPGEPVPLSVIAYKYQGLVVHWDPISHTPWIDYIDENGTCHQVWFDNVTSLAMKLDYAESMGIGGFGYWALGYENAPGVMSDIDSLTASRMMDPGIDNVKLIVRNGRILLEIEGARRIARIEANITLREALPGMVTAGGFGAGFTNSSFSVIGGSVRAVFTSTGTRVPGVGVTGGGSLLEFNTTGEATGVVVDVRAYYAIIRPDWSVVLEEAPVGNVGVVFYPLEPPAAGVLSGVGYSGFISLFIVLMSIIVIFIIYRIIKYSRYK